VASVFGLGSLLAGLLFGDAICIWVLKACQPDVGRQCDNRFRITVQESRLAPNIGLDDRGVAHPEVGTIHTRLGGQPVKTGEDDI